MEVLKTTSTPRWDNTQRTNIMQWWTVIQYTLMPELKDEVGSLTLLNGFQRVFLGQF
jgi:hypothetical protein